MYRSEALAAISKAEDDLASAKENLYWAEQDLLDAECDHPDTDGLQCTHCRVFHIPEAHLQDMDDFNVQLADLQGLKDEGFPGSHRWGSVYYIFPA